MKSKKIVDQKTKDDNDGFHTVGGETDVVERLYRDATNRLEKTFFTQMDNENVGNRFSSVGGNQPQPHIS